MLALWTLSIVILPIAALPSIASLPGAPLLHVLLAIGLKLLQRLPLVGCQLSADAQQETCVGFFELSPSGSDLVDLGQNLGFVRLIVAHQGLHLELGLLQIGMEVNQPFAMREQRGVHLLALSIGELERVNNLGVIPPAAMVPLGAHRLFKGGPMLSKARSPTAWSHASAGALSQRRRRQQNRSNRKSKTCSQPSFHCFLLPLTLVRDGDFGGAAHEPDYLLSSSAI